MNCLRTLPLFFSCAGVIVSLQVHAGNFDVAPIRVTLDEQTTSAALTLRNAGPTEVVIHAEVLKWNAPENYSPTREILVNPPIFRIPAQGSQVIRVGLLQPLLSSTELAYRLYLQEVLPPPKKGTSGLRTALRLGVPIFIPPKVVRSDLRWSATRSKDGSVQIEAINRGNTHIQLIDLKLDIPGNPTLSRRVRQYLLPGQTSRWNLGSSARWNQGSINLEAKTDGGEVHATLEVQAS
ncbi:MAG: fimbria/pilus periplasmic chaperone [Bdellovibrionales bacterium]|nr:fimbria/pilus periplasmic chaperone [Bdellovibrionales bacterium]